VVLFYPKDMTQGCTIEAHNFQQDLARYHNSNAVIVGVSVDSTTSHREFCAKASLTFKLLADMDKKVVDQYGSLGARDVASRNTFLIDPAGKIVKVDRRQSRQAQPRNPRHPVGNEEIEVSIATNNLDNFVKRTSLSECAL